MAKPIDQLAQGKQRIEEIKASIRAGTLEIERIEGVIEAIDQELAKAVEHDGNVKNQVRGLKDRLSTFEGLEALGRLSDAEAQEKVATIETMTNLQATDSRASADRINAIQGKRKAVDGVLATERASLDRMTIELQSAIREHVLAIANIEAANYVKLAKQLIESVTKLGAIQLENQDMDIVDLHHAGFALPTINLAEFKEQTDGLPFIGYTSGRESLWDNLKVQIIAYEGMVI